MAKILILGGGFGGLIAAEELAFEFGSRIEVISRYLYQLMDEILN